MKPSGSDYSRRINRVADVVRSGLRGDFSLARLAGEARFPPNQFRRVFKAATGSDRPTIGIRNEPDGKPAIVPYYRVADIAAVSERAVKPGATLRLAPMLSGGVHFCLMHDPEGNPFGPVDSNTP